MPLFTDVTVESQSPGIASTRAPLLRGFTTRFDAFGRPLELAGRGMLEEDISFLVRRILTTRGLLRMTFSESDLGNVAKLLQEEIENPENWWSGQATPISLSQVLITLRTVTKVGGVSISSADDGNLQIQIGYTERATGVVVRVDGGDALVIPFGSFLALEGNV